MSIMTSKQFIEKLKFAASKKTLYCQGCFGAPLNAKNRERYSKNTKYNREHAAQIKAASSDTFGFDCVCLIKGILWGWTGDLNLEYGGAKYNSNGVPDFGDGQMLNYCTDVSSNFEGILPGEVLWMSGHVGVYIGGGQVIESTAKWTANVLYSNLKNIGFNSGNARKWTKHGKLKWIDYSDAKDTIPTTAPSTSTPATTTPVKETTSTQNNTSETVYTVVRGDTLSKIGTKFGVDWQKIASLNNIKSPYIINIGQKIKIPGKTTTTSSNTNTSSSTNTTPEPVKQETKEQYHIVQRGETLSKIGAKYGIDWKKIASLNNIKSPYTIYVGQKIRIK